MQSLTDDVARPDDHQLTQPAGENAVSGHYQSTDTTAIDERETREIDDDGGGCRLHQRIGQEACGHDVELATERHEVDVELWELLDGNAEFWQHGEAISAEGCRWQIARRSVSSFMLPLFCIGRFGGRQVSPQITQQPLCTRGFRLTWKRRGPDRRPYMSNSLPLPADSSVESEFTIPRCGAVGRPRTKRRLRCQKDS
jgi:hypothetical protein